MRLRSAVVIALLLSTPAGVLAEEPASDAGDAAAAFMASLKPRTGTIELPGSIARLKLSDDFTYLDPGDTQKLLEDAWGNPPGAGAGTLGMILPAAVSPVSDEGWGVIVTYTDDGHVADGDANTIDYGKLLQDMQEQTRDANAEREKQGFEPVTLAGWAEPPHYDGASHKIYWAKDLAFGTGDKHTLNYSVRVLGREGVLELNAVAGMAQLAQVREDMKQVTAMADFTAGNGYNDFNSDTDKIAAYGLAALVAGGVAAKAGLFAKLLALLVAAKKLVILAGLAIVGFIGKLFGKKKPA